MINVSKTAASKISERLVEDQKAGGGLRVFEQGGGCSGFQYGMMIDEKGQGARRSTERCVWARAPPPVEAECGKKAA